jgi:trimethylamine corrinoid protein
MNLVEELRKSILNFDENGSKEIAKKIVEAGMDPIQAIERGLVPGIREIGDKFEKGELFLPHLVIAADIAKSAIDILLPSSSSKAKISKGKVVLGTVEGDLHDIGINIVSSMLTAAGFEVHNIGKDRPVKDFIEKAQSIGADIIGVSSLMTVTMPEQRKLIDELKDRGLRDKFKVMVGGGPVTMEWAKEIGADGYGRDASDAVRVAMNLLGIREEKHD